MFSHHERLLHTYPTDMVRLGCTKCDRSGRYRLATLIERFGPEAGLANVPGALSQECPKWITPPSRTRGVAHQERLALGRHLGELGRRGL